MKYRTRIYYTDEKKSLLWDRGEYVHQKEHVQN